MTPLFEIYFSVWQGSDFITNIKLQYEISHILAEKYYFFKKKKKEHNTWNQQEFWQLYCENIFWYY